MKRILVFVVCFSTIISCKKDKTADRPYIVDPELLPYVQMFVAEGNQRGQNIQLDKEGLIIQFGDVPYDSLAGWCDYTGTHTITIDKNQWDNSDEEFRQLTVFHELGHCYLGRGHKHDTFYNGEWQSIMTGYPFPVNLANKLPNLVFDSIRRKYYLDELFGGTAAAPWWVTSSETYNSVPASSKTVLFEDNFDNNMNNWPIINNSDTETKIENGYYKVISKGPIGKSIGNADFQLPTNYDFEIECVMKNIPTDPLGSNQGSGIKFGGLDTYPDNTRLLYFSQKEGIIVGNVNLKQYQTALTPLGMDFNNFTKFTFRKKGFYYYYFVNETLLFVDAYQSFSGDFRIAFRSGAYATTLVDKLTYSRF